MIPSGFLIYLLIHNIVKAITKLAPAESPAKMIFFGYIPNHYFQ